MTADGRGFKVHMLWTVAFVFFVGAIVIKLLGCFDTTEVSISAKPSLFSDGLTIYYMNNVGTYHGCFSVCRKLMQLIPNGAGRGICIHYGDRSKGAAHLLKSAVGVIVQIGSEAIADTSVIEDLEKRGLRKKTFPTVISSVTASCHMNFACAILPAPLNSISKMFKVIQNFAKKRSLSTSLAVEFYTLDTSLVTVHFPLDHQNEFAVSVDD